MKEKITWEDAHLFDYINEIEFLYVTDMDDYEYRINIETGSQNTEAAEKIEAPVFGYSEIVAIFKNRYNEGKLSKQNIKRITQHEQIGFISRIKQKFNLGIL